MITETTEINAVNSPRRASCEFHHHHHHHHRPRHDYPAHKAPFQAPIPAQQPRKHFSQAPLPIKISKHFFQAADASVFQAVH